MQTNTLVKITLTTTLALALFAVSFHAVAADTAKGGAQQLLSKPAAIQTTDLAAAPSAMSCGKCRDVAGTSVTPLGKGAFLKSTSYMTHTCCSTAIQTAGSGKAKTDGATHTCANDAKGCGAM